MRILLDECLPKGLKRAFCPRYNVLTVPEVGWNGLKNGALLSRVAEKFDVFVTADKNIQYQQNLAAYPIIFVLMEAPSSDIAVLEPLVPRVIAAIQGAEAGKLVVVAA